MKLEALYVHLHHSTLVTNAQPQFVSPGYTVRVLHILLGNCSWANDEPLCLHPAIVAICSSLDKVKFFQFSGYPAVADTGGFVRVRTNPPFFQVINLLFHCSMHSASGLVGKPHPLTSNLQLGHSCRGGSCLLTSLQLEFT